MAGGLAVAALVGCGAPTAAHPVVAPPAASTASATSLSVFAEDDTAKPAYGKPELDQALVAERGLAAAQDRQVSDLEDRPADPASTDALRAAIGDLAVRRRFIAMLETCAASGHLCPPRLDDPPWSFDPDQASTPPVTAALRFDLASWRTLAAELHGRACACRTVACVDSVGTAIDQLEVRPMHEVQDDDAAALAVTHARECLFRLRGKLAISPATPADVD